MTDYLQVPFYRDIKLQNPSSYFFSEGFTEGETEDIPQHASTFPQMSAFTGILIREGSTFHIYYKVPGFTFPSLSITNSCKHN